MSIPAAQVDPFTRKLGSTRKRRPKLVRRQTGKPEPSSPAPPPKTIFGRPKPQPPAPQGQRMLDWAGLRAKGIHYHPNYLRRMWKRGDFPKPFKPTPHRLAWWEDEIDEWIKEASAGQPSPNEAVAPLAGDATLDLSKLLADATPEQLAAVRTLLGRGQLGADGKHEPSQGASDERAPIGECARYGAVSTRRRSRGADQLAAEPKRSTAAQR